MQSTFRQALDTISARPVYSDARVALYHADCRDILWDIQPSRDTTVISDPPYGIRWRDPTTNRRVLGDDRPFDPSHLLRFRCVLFGGQHYHTRLPQGGSWQIWDKRCPHRGQSPACACGPCRTNCQGDFEDIWCSFHAHRTIYRHYWNGGGKASERGVKRIHVTQKPVLLMGWLVETHTAPGDLVIDPYAGSCSTLIAARLAGRYAIGVELDDTLIGPAVDRLKGA